MPKMQAYGCLHPLRDSTDDCRTRAWKEKKKNKMSNPRGMKVWGRMGELGDMD